MTDGSALLRDHLIVALDLDTVEEALALVDELYPRVERFKIGSRMFTAHGPVVLEELARRGAKVFLDLKFHDIPTVIGDACRIVAEKYPSVFMLTVHASGGAQMVAAAVEGAGHRKDGSLDVVAVTALTSLSPSETRLLGIDMNLDSWALKLGELALDAGADGLVCSAVEVGLMRETFGQAPIFVTPGIRPAADHREEGDDQARTTTPQEALERGSSYLVMGRPVYRASDPGAVIDELARSLS